MDHSLKSVVLLQDQLLQIFFDDLFSERPAQKPQDAVSPPKKSNPPIKETKREIQSNESINEEVHNVYDGEQSPANSILSQKTPLAASQPVKKRPSDDDMDFHDIYEVRESQHVNPEAPKKTVFINLEQNMVMGKEPLAKSKFKQSCVESVKDNPVDSGAGVFRRNIAGVGDRLMILIIAYHNFAVELEYLGRARSRNRRPQGEQSQLLREDQTRERVFAAREPHPPSDSSEPGLRGQRIFGQDREHHQFDEERNPPKEVEKGIALAGQEKAAAASPRQRREGESTAGHVQGSEAEAPQEFSNKVEYNQAGAGALDKEEFEAAEKFPVPVERTAQAADSVGVQWVGEAEEVQDQAQKEECHERGAFELRHEVSLLGGQGRSRAERVPRRLEEAG